MNSIAGSHQISRKTGKIMNTHPNYKYIKTNEWNSLSIEQRKQLLNFIENEQARKQNRQPIPINFQKIEGFGSYSRVTQSYIINEALLNNNLKRINPKTGKIEQLFNSFEALDTIIHEGYHREQHLLAMGDSRVMPYLQGAKRQKFKQEVCDNFLNYSTPNYNLQDRGLTSFAEYYLQPLEISVIMKTNSDLVFNNILYNDIEYKEFLNQKLDEEKQIRLEAIKVYGPNYERELDKLREIRSFNPEKASQVESRFRDEQRRYEEENRHILRDF